jgi:hypothetical protein
MTRSLLPLIIASSLFALGNSPSTAEAGLVGKTYNVTVTKNFVREFDDFYAFQPSGVFVSLRGGVGEWEQTNLLVLTIWWANFDAGDSIRIDFMGVQMGSQIVGFGSNQEGDFFRAVGTEGPYDGNLVEEGTNLYVPD